MVIDLRFFAVHSGDKHGATATLTLDRAETPGMESKSTVDRSH